MIKTLIEEIKDAAFQVRLALAPGYLESVYKNALIYELQKRDLEVGWEVPIIVRYRGVPVGEFRADIIVEGQVILEIKAVSSITSAHELQLVNYLTATGIDHGILINYGSNAYAFRYKSRIYHPR